MNSASVWIPVCLLAVLMLVVLRGPISACTKLLARSIGSFFILSVLSPLSSLLGISVGVNAVNCLVLGLLGIPGFGLLMMTNWIFSY